MYNFCCFPVDPVLNSPEWESEANINQIKTVWDWTVNVSNGGSQQCTQTLVGLCKDVGIMQEFLRTSKFMHI